MRGAGIHEMLEASIGRKAPQRRQARGHDHQHGAHEQVLERGLANLSEISHPESRPRTAMSA